jgi:hypothetical protein
MKYIHPFIAFCIIIVCSGCASNKLTLTLDMYREDPALTVPLSSQQLAERYQFLDQSRIDTNSYVSLRNRHFANLSTNYVKLPLVGKNNEPLNTSIRSYRESLTIKKSTLFDQITSARGNLNNYTKIIGNNSIITTSNSELLTARIALDKSISALSRCLTELFSPPQQFMRTMTSLKNDYIKNVKIFVDNKGKLNQYDKEASRTFFDLLRSLDVISDTKKEDVIPNDIASTPHQTDEDKVSLMTKLQGSSLRFSQLDRLQDPADPVWRVISSPENKDKWNKKFTNTSFVAEGNSQVIVVRDNPMSYRVHQGSNNPTALIQSQLQISRAVGNLALSVAAAAGGIKVPISIPGQSKDQPAENNQTDLVTQKAALQITTEKRIKVLNNIRVGLSEINAQLASVDPNDAVKFNGIRNRASSIISAGKYSLDSLKQKENTE